MPSLINGTMTERTAQMPTKTGAGWYFSCAHKDPIRAEIHGHTYEVIAWWDYELGLDAVTLQKQLKFVLDKIDHTTLSDDMTRAEDIAPFIGKQLDGCVGIEIFRPSERLFVRWWL